MATHEEYGQLLTLLHEVLTGCRNAPVRRATELLAKHGLEVPSTEESEYPTYQAMREAWQEMKAKLKKNATSALDLSEARIAQLKQRDERIAELEQRNKHLFEVNERQTSRVTDLELGVRGAVEALMDMVNQHCTERGGDGAQLFDGALSANEDAIAYLETIGRIKDNQLVWKNDG